MGINIKEAIDKIIQEIKDDCLLNDDFTPMVSPVLSWRGLIQGFCSCCRSDLEEVRVGKFLTCSSCVHRQGEIIFSKARSELAYKINHLLDNHSYLVEETDAPWAPDINIRNWYNLISVALTQNGETWDDVVGGSVSIEDLKQSFVDYEKELYDKDHKKGTFYTNGTGRPFTLWTDKYVYSNGFDCDQALTVQAVLRNPIK